jgi:hypothetical protein
MIATFLLLTLHISAGSAADRLMELARAADVSVMYDYASLDSVKTNALDGQYSLPDALCAMLDGTFATYEFTSMTTITAELSKTPQPCMKPVGWGPPWIHPPQANWH